jgi:hypothetical protein
MPIYGHRHLGLFFRPLVEVREHGLVFSGAEYDWGAIERVEVYDSPLDPLAWFSFVGGKSPTATVYLKDGKNIRLNARALEKRGVKPEIAFLSGKSDAFQELIAVLKSHGVSNVRGPRVIVLQVAKLIAFALVGILLIFATLSHFGIIL